MQKPVTISTQKPEDAAFDYEALRKIGIAHLEKTASAIWTDYNVHDPGITTLELLCYALTDLSYRAKYSIPDLLATEENTVQNIQDHFFSAKQIFPNKAVTINDYRKLIIDIEGVANAWLTKRREMVFADITHKKLTHLQPTSEKWQTVNVKGYYDVMLEFDINLPDERKEDIKTEARKVLMANRNLCEDFVDISEIARQEFRLCSEIEIKASANPFDTLAQMFFNIQIYLTPLIRFYSLQQLRDKNITTNSIFEGPLLEHGFIINDELVAAGLKTELHLSDIMGAILKVDDVANILDIVFNPIDETKELANKWIIAVSAAQQPVINITESNVLFYKEGIPFRPALNDLSLVKTKFEKLMSDYIGGNDSVVTEDISYPIGRFQNVDSYYSIQNHYPKNYGIGQWGLPADASDESRMQAKQLQAYLLFFDQQLANYFSQLFHLRDLFSWQNESTTFFMQRVNSIKDGDDLFIDLSTIDNKLQAAAEPSGSEAYFKRRNMFLDHLLSRFAESFFDYTNTLQFVFPNADPQGIINSKMNFLQNYPAYSSGRFAAYDYTNSTALWNTDNTSGLEKRMERLLGFENIQRRSLVNVYTAVQQRVNEASQTVFWFEIIDNRSNTVLLRSGETVTTKETVAGSLETALEFAGNIINFSIVQDAETNLFTYQLQDKKANIIGFSKLYNTNSDAAAAANSFVSLMADKQSEEGMFLIEHVLLFNKAITNIPASPPNSPAGIDDDLLPICVDDNCDECDDTDPYSFRISIVLPAYARRFLNIDFRRYCERVIRTETPAHIFPKICWVSNEDLREFELAYQDWLKVKSGTLEDADNTILVRFVKILTTLKSVYPHARLEDCKNTEERKLFLLNQNILGSLKT